MAAELDQLCINTLRFLSVDAVQKANSGHPGMPLGAAPMAYVLWTRFLKHNPRNPDWFDRDRFVLSAGHGSMLLYSLLHLTGYDLSLDDIKQFRQWGSKTPGHPERGHTPGVEVTTGPLGQGFANAVGMAIAEAQLAARYNRAGYDVIDHRTYAIVSDGDLMEGVASEAASLAGHLRLGKLICLYDDNHVTLAAGTDITFSRGSRRALRGVRLAHADRSPTATTSLRSTPRCSAARAETTRPSLILVRTHIGYGSPNKQDSFEAHGSPLGVDEVRLTKQNLGWPDEPPFLIPEPALAHFREALARGARRRSRVERAHGRVRAGVSRSRRASCDAALRGELPAGWDADIPVFPADAKGMATRVARGKVMNAIAPRAAGVDRRLGRSRSVDLYRAQGTRRFQSGRRERRRRYARARHGGGWSYAGRNLHFGVREHAMGAIVNGLAAHGGTHAVRRDVPDLLRLHAPADPPRGADGTARRPRVHARQHRARRGRPDAPAGRAARRRCARSRTSP